MPEAKSSQASDNNEGNGNDDKTAKQESQSQVKGSDGGTATASKSGDKITTYHITNNYTTIIAPADVQIPGQAPPTPISQQSVQAPVTPKQPVTPVEPLAQKVKFEITANAAPFGTPYTVLGGVFEVGKTRELMLGEKKAEVTVSIPDQSPAKPAPEQVRTNEQQVLGQVGVVVQPAPAPSAQPLAIEVMMTVDGEPSIHGIFKVGIPNDIVLEEQPMKLHVSIPVETPPQGQPSQPLSGQSPQPSSSATAAPTGSSNKAPTMAPSGSLGFATTNSPSPQPSQSVGTPLSKQLPQMTPTWGNKIPAHRRFLNRLLRSEDEQAREGRTRANANERQMVH